MDGHLHRRRWRQPAAVDITWISCRGVRSPVPFHAPSLYASVSVASSTADNQTARRAHRVTTPADGDGGENPEWDAPLRLYLPDDAAGQESEDALLVTFELREELLVLGDVLAASAAVPVADIGAAGGGQATYQLAAPDGKHPNGVISFSYVFHGDAVKSPAPAEAGVHWSSTEQVAVYPPIAVGVAAEAPPVRVYPPPLPDAACGVAAEEPVAVYPPLPEAPCGIYPPVGLAPSSYFPPPPPSASNAGVCGCPAVPEWGDRW